MQIAEATLTAEQRLDACIQSIEKCDPSLLKPLVGDYYAPLYVQLVVLTALLPCPLEPERVRNALRASPSVYNRVVKGV